MSGTGRRRKPPTGEEGNEQQYPQQQPYEQPQYQTYAPAPDPQYDYDWRQQSAASTPPAAPVPPAAPSSAPSPVPPPAVPQQPQYGDYSDQYADQYADPYAPPYADPYAQSGTDPYAQSGPGGASAPGGSVPGGISSVLGSGQYTVPQPPPAAPPVPQPSVPQSPFVPPQPGPAAPSGGPARDAFDFDVDLDFDDLGGPASSGPSGPAAPAASPASVPMPAGVTAGATSPDAVAAPTSASASDPGSGPAPATSGGGARSGDKDGYRPDDFDFVDTENDPDVGGWLTFTESRADTRAERARRMRVRLIALGVVVVLVAAGVGIYAWLGGGLPGTGGQPQATKSMILFRLDDSTGDAVGDALLVTNRGGSSGSDGGSGSTGGSSTGTGALVVIPSQMEIDAQGFGSQPFGGNMQSVQPPADSSEVSDILGVTPDGQWTMDETTFHIFVDELGGLSVTTNTAVPPSTADPKGVPRGATTLSGVQAVAYATYQATGESASVQAARFGQVLEALMAKMPTTSISVAAYLKQLGYIPEPGLPVTTLSPILASLAAQQAAGHVTVATLPLSADGSNTLNASAAAKIVTNLLGGTVKAGASAGQAARVLVQNGTGSSGETASKLLAAAQAKIVDSGYTFNPGSTVGSQAHTVVEVATSSGQGLAQQVAASLGLSGSAVQVVSGLSSPDDVTVVLGQDWSSLSTQ